MHLRILKALAGLLALSPLLHAAPATEPAASHHDRSNARSSSSYLRRRDDVYDKADSDSILEEYKAWTGVTDISAPFKRSTGSDVVTSTLAKRLQALDVVAVNGDVKVVKRANWRMKSKDADGWGDTWFGYAPEEPGWTPDTIKGLVQYAYDDMVAQGADTRTVVSALWIPGRGCFFGSLPKGDGKTRLPAVAPHVAPILWRLIRNRRVVSKNPDFAKYHAEDMACFEYERRVSGNTDGYPDGARIYSYGLAGGMSTAGPKAACKTFGAGIIPSCEDTMHDLNVLVGPGLRKG